MAYNSCSSRFPPTELLRNYGGIARAFGRVEGLGLRPKMNLHMELVVELVNPNLEDLAEVWALSTLDGLGASIGGVALDGSKSGKSCAAFWLDPAGP